MNFALNGLKVRKRNNCFRYHFISFTGHGQGSKVMHIYTRANMNPISAISMMFKVDREGLLVLCCLRFLFY